MAVSGILLVLIGLIVLAGIGLVLVGLAREGRMPRAALIVLALIAVPILCWLAWLAIMVLIVGPGMR